MSYGSMLISVYHIASCVGLSMLDAEDRYGSEDRYWRFAAAWGMQITRTRTEGSSGRYLRNLVLVNRGSHAAAHADLIYNK